MLAACRSVDAYERLSKISEGTYGVVYKARDKGTGRVVALKKVKMAREADGFPLTSVREINILLACHHPAIVDVAEVVVGASLDATYVVMEFCPHDLAGLAALLARPFTVAETKCVMRQLIAGAAFLHGCWVLHRDFKPANVLVGPARGAFKHADFGLARPYGSPLRPYTQPVVTLYYRAPELLLGCGEYGPAVDVWSLGCVAAELLLGRTLFQPSGAGGRDGDVAQMDAISRLLGPVCEERWPGCSRLKGLRAMRYAHAGAGLRSLLPPPGIGFDNSQRVSAAGIELLQGMLAYDPSQRLTADKALAHPWFSEYPPATDPALMPSFPEGAQKREGG